MRVVACLVVLAACSFEHGVAGTQGSGAIDAPSNDGRIPDGRPVDARPIDAPSCPGNYTASNGSRYRVVTQQATWTTAEADCADDGFGTHLVVTVNGSEVGTVDAITSASNIWVGESDRITQGVWKWVSGQAAFNLGNFTTYRCGRYFDGSGTSGGAALQADDCTNTFPYVCECDLTEPEPGSF